MGATRRRRVSVRQAALGRRAVGSAPATTEHELRAPGSRHEVLLPARSHAARRRPRPPRLPVPVQRRGLARVHAPRLTCRRRCSHAGDRRDRTAFSSLLADYDHLAQWRRLDLLRAGHKNTCKIFVAYNPSDTKYTVNRDV